MKKLPNVPHDRSAIPLTWIDGIDAEERKKCTDAGLSTSAHIVAHKDSPIVKQIFKRDKAKIRKIEDQHENRVMGVRTNHDYPRI